MEVIQGILIAIIEYLLTFIFLALMTIIIESLQWIFTGIKGYLPILISLMLTVITYRMYSLSSQPEVVTYLRLDRYLVFICLENIGKGAARDIYFKIPVLIPNSRRQDIE